MFDCVLNMPLLSMIFLNEITNYKVKKSRKTRVNDVNKLKKQHSSLIIVFTKFMK